MGGRGTRKREKGENILPGSNLSPLELSQPGMATPVSRLSPDREKMSWSRQLGKIVSPLPSAAPFPYRMKRGRPRCRRVLATTSKNLGALRT